MPDAERRLLVLCERDVGLFSLIQQVIANIPRAIAEERTPVAHFGEGCVYFTPAGYRDRDTVWEYYFEPLVADASVAAIPASVLERIRTEPPDDVTVGYDAGAGCFASNNFGGDPD